MQRAPAPLLARHQAFQAAASCYKSLFARPSFDSHNFTSLKLVDADHGWVAFRGVVDEHKVNRFGKLHGGYTASLVDVVGSIAIAAMGCQVRTVSSDISVSYLAAAPADSNLYVEGTCHKRGRSLAFTSVRVYASDWDVTRSAEEEEEAKLKQALKLVAMGSHTKFIGHGMSES